MNRRCFLGWSVAALAGCGTSARRAGAGPRVWGTAGRRNGAFVHPRAIGVFRDEVYVIDTTARVQVFAMDGTYARQWSLPKRERGTPTAVAFDGQGRVMIPDTHYHRILVYTPQGDLLDQWGSYGAGPDEFIYPTGLVEALDGALYISEYGEDAERIHVFDASHEFLRQWGEFGEGPGQFNRAMALAMAPDGTLHVVDTGNHRVQRFDTEGQLLGTFGAPGEAPGELNAPFDIVGLADGSVWVCEFGNHRVSHFSATGAFLGTVGSPGRELGQLHEPRGVAVSSGGALYVADTGNHRIQCWAAEDLEA